MAELGAEHVIDEEIEGGVDVGGQHDGQLGQAVGVVVAAAQTELFDAQHGEAQQQAGQEGHHVQHRRPDQHPRQRHVPAQRRVGCGAGGGPLPPAGQPAQPERRHHGAGGDHGDAELRHDHAVSHGVQRVHHLLVGLEEPAGVDGRVGGVGLRVEDADDVPLGCGHEVAPDEHDEGDGDDDGHGLGLQHGVGAERADHAEAPLTRDDGRHPRGRPAEAVQPYDVVVHHELRQRTLQRSAGQLVVDTVRVQTQALEDVDEVGQGQAEETQVDALLQTVLHEDGHV